MTTPRVIARATTLVALTLAARSIAAQEAAIPIRQVTPAVSTDSGVLMSLNGIRPLSDKRVVANDYARKRILLFDSTLKKFTIVADTAAGAPTAYGTLSTGLIAYNGDTTLVVDRSSTAFLLIDPKGKIGDIVSPPKASDIYYMSTGFIDKKGHIFYRGYRRAPPSKNPPAPAPVTNTSAPQITSSGVDSAPVIRADFDSRSVDTVGMLKIPIDKMAMVRMTSPTGGQMGFGFGVFNPMPLTDEWTVLSDGTIVIVRGIDYHIDWISPDGKMRSTPKMPFEWKRVTLEDKQLVVDSIKKANDAKPEAQRTLTMSDGTKFPMPNLVVDPADLPDYYPPVRSGQVKADPEDNVWVLPSTSVLAKGGLLFDVVNHNGEVFERVQLPPNRTLIGFGPGGTLYLSPPPPTGAPTTGTSIERVQIIRPAGATIKP